MIVIPFEQLQPQTLRAVIEEFVTRDGAIHGHSDVLLEQSVRLVQSQLRSGKIVIVFDEETETCGIVAIEETIRTQPSERRIERNVDEMIVSKE
jgi:uncharacterized protein